jgi:spore maturation protein CgeB
MRWVVAQPGAAFSVHDVYVGWVEALRDLGETVIPFNLDDRLTFYGSAHFELGGETRKIEPHLAVDLAANGLYATLYKARPDILLVVSGFFVPLDLYEMARVYGTRIVVLHTESPYEDDRQVGVAQHADLNLLNDPTNIDRFPAGTLYMPHAYRPSLHSPGPAKPELMCDLGFVGTGYPSRIAFLEQMDLEGLDVLLAGNWGGLSEESPLRPYIATDIKDCLDNEEAVDIYRSARVGLNMYRREAQSVDLVDGWAMGPREVELAATRCFFLRDPRPESDETFPMLPSFSSPAEASDMLRYWLKRPAERERLATAARDAIAERTFKNHAASLLRVLDQ